MEITIDKVEELIAKASEVEGLVKDFFTKVQIEYSPMPSGIIGWSDYGWTSPVADVLDSQIKSMEMYEEWYSMVQTIVSRLHPERKADLNDMYEKNKDILELSKVPWDSDKSKFQSDFLRNLSKQKSILASTKGLVGDTPIAADTPTQASVDLGGLEQNMYVDLKSQMMVLSHQFSRYESDIKDLSQKIDSIGRITINNINQNSAKVGDITVSNEYIVKGMKPDLDNELNNLGSEADKIDEGEEKEIIKDLIKDILKEKSPKVDWLKDKLSKLKYWGMKAGLTIVALKKYADLLGAS